MNSQNKRIFNWEKLPFGLLYAPLSIVWLWYIIKSWRVWWFVPVNPTLEFAGFEGEGKKEMYEQLPDWSIPTTIFIKPSLPICEAIKNLIEAKLTYPIIAKPDKGMQGVLFRIIENDEQFTKYHATSPDEYVVQTFISYPIELSVFHIRYPHEDKGRITGFIMKEYLQVKGDGKTNLKTLIENHPKAKLRMEEMTHKHGKQFENIIANEETYFLSFAGNHNRGAKFLNLHNQIDEPLLNLFAKISNHTKTFYYGRYDVKCQSLEDLKAGKNFSILEYNGAGAEPNHIYDCNMSLGKAYKTIMNHWADMYAIAKINNKAGVPYWSALKGWRFLMQAKKDFKIMSKVDLELKL